MKHQIKNVHDWKLNIMYGGGKPQWTVLQHNGPIFPPPYVPHKVPVIINGNEVILPEQAEEYATMYAKFIGTDYDSNNTFRKNFWKELKSTLPTNIKIESLDQLPKNM